MADDLGNFMKPPYGDYHRIRQSPGCHHRPGRQLFGCPAVWGFIFQTSNVDQWGEITDNLGCELPVCWRLLKILGYLRMMTSNDFDPESFCNPKQFVAKSCRLASASPSARQPSFAAPAPVLALASPLVEPNTVWPCLTTVNMCSMAWRCLKVPKSIKHRQCAPPCLSLSPSLPLPCQIQTCGHQTPHIRHGYSNSTATVSHVTFSALWNHVVSLCCSNERMLVGSVLGVV